MSFVRTKEIPPGSGNLYDYEVMGYRDNGRVRQKVIRYLGKHGTDHSHLLGGTVSPELRSVTVAPTPKPSTPLADTTRIPKMKTPAQRMSRVVPFKDWNDIVRDSKEPDIDYKVTLYRRQSAKRKTVFDAKLTPVEVSQ